MSIFIGLLYVAWCINPTVFDSLIYKEKDLYLISIVVVLAFMADVLDIVNKYKKS